MVKLRAPMMSLGASGSLGNAITFSKWKGRAYARELVVPSNPKSGLQTGFRAMFAFLSQQWTNVSTGDQATWQTLADQLVASPFNAYMRGNQRRWRNFTPPAEATPAAEAATPPTWTSEPDVAGGVDSILMSWDVNVINDSWGMVIFRALTTGFTPSISNVVKVVQLTAAGAGTWLDSPLVADQYFYDCRPFTTDGLFGALTGEVEDTVS